MLIARQLIQRGMPVLWIDAERSFRKDYAQLLGLDVDAIQKNKDPLFTLLKTETAEATYDATVMALELGYHKLIVLDTLAQLVPTVEASASLSKDQMGVFARGSSRFTRVANNALDRSGAIFAILNQERVAIGQYGAPPTNSGGKAITEHWPNLIVKTARNEAETKYANGRPALIVFRYDVKKYRGLFQSHAKRDDYHVFAVTCSRDRYEVNLGYEIFVGATLLHLLQDKDGGVWKKNNAYFQGELIANGQAKILDWFQTRSNLRDAIQAAVIAEVERGNYGDDQGDTQAVSEDESGEAGPGEREDAADADGDGDFEGSLWDR
jgi:hypothetical protein